MPLKVIDEEPLFSDSMLFSGLQVFGCAREVANNNQLESFSLNFFLCKRNYFGSDFTGTLMVYAGGATYPTARLVWSTPVPKGRWNTVRAKWMFCSIEIVTQIKTLLVVSFSFSNLQLQFLFSLSLFFSVYAVVSEYIHVSVTKGGLFLITRCSSITLGSNTFCC